MARAVRGPAGVRLSLAVAAVALAACAAEERYAGDTLVAFAITEETPPLAMAEEGEGATAFMVEYRVTLPLRPLNDTVREALENGDATPFPRRPWIRHRDVAIEVDWVLYNLTETPATVAVTVNGFNEFHEYVPRFVVEDDELLLDFSGWERTIVLPGFGSTSGTIRREHFDEIAVDLATVANGAPNFNVVMHPDSQSSRDPRVRPYIPAIIPGLVGFRLGIRTIGTAPRVVLEASVHLRDDGDRLVREGDTPWDPPEPELISPRASMDEMDDGAADDTSTAPAPEP
ncbi:MAG: hypothetical protein NZ898_05395 [Myxococcota bacterium]|nr:hypothetical protein [Myxococcota bacterium]MDW8362084.1 hypothetical protein [Myxococcales bacterium]